jgi:excisionase family DNA binding protein
MEDRHLSLSEVAGSLGVSERTVRRWIKSGKLRAYKPGRDYRIPETAVRELIEGSEISPKALRRSSLELSLFNSVNDERQHEGLLRTYRAAAAFGRTVVESFKNFKPLDMQRLAAFHQLENGLLMMRGKRDILGNEPEDLADAIGELEEVSTLVNEKLNEHLDTSSTKERQKFERGLREMMERITA